MKVKYVELRDGVVGPWLNGGEIYSVLAIHADVSGIRYRIISDASQTPALYHASLFKIISHHIPSSWIVNVGNNGDFIEMASEPWTASDFWEKFFDGDTYVVRIFEEEIGKIMTEEI